MVLSREGTNATVGERFRKRFCAAAHESWALAAIDGERRRLYGLQLDRGQREIADDRRFIDQRMRGGLERRPERRMPQLHNDLFRNPDQPRLEELDCLATVA